MKRSSGIRGRHPVFAAAIVSPRADARRLAAPADAASAARPRDRSRSRPRGCSTGGPTAWSRTASSLVEGSKIRDAGSGLAIPPGATVIDLGDATLLPGFIDAHTHLTGQASDNWLSDFY